MPAQQRRVMSSQTVNGSTEVNLDLALDLLEYRDAWFVVRVEGAGEGDSIVLQVKHAATNEEEAYVDFEEPIEVALDATGIQWFHVSSLLRWVYWFVSGTFTADATVTIDVIARP